MHRREENQHVQMEVLAQNISEQLLAVAGVGTRVKSGIPSLNALCSGKCIVHAMSRSNWLYLICVPGTHQALLAIDLFNVAYAL